MQLFFKVKVITICTLGLSAQLASSDLFKSISTSIKLNGDSSSETQSAKDDFKRFTRYCELYKSFNFSDHNETAQSNHLKKAILLELNRTENRHLNSLTCKDDNNQTLNLLHLATIKNDIEFITNLLARQANIDAQSDKGNTALHFAVKYKHIQAAEELLKNNAKIDIANNNGFTSYDKTTLTPGIFAAMRKKYPQASCNNANLHWNQFKDAGSSARNSIVKTFENIKNS